jgi:hypothetical protein
MIRMPDRCPPSGLCKRQQRPLSFVHWSIHSVHHSIWVEGRRETKNCLSLLNAADMLNCSNSCILGQPTQYLLPTPPSLWIENPLHLLCCIIEEPPTHSRLSPFYIIHPPLIFVVFNNSVLLLSMASSLLFTLPCVSQRGCQLRNNRNKVLFNKRPACCHWVSLDSREQIATTNGSILNKQRDKMSSRNRW